MQLIVGELKEELVAAIEEVRNGDRPTEADGELVLVVRRLDDMAEGIGRRVRIACPRASGYYDFSPGRVEAYVSNILLRMKSATVP
jgi:hypothetical protein